MHNIARQLHAIHTRIIDAETEFGRKTGQVQCLAVSKRQPMDKIKAAIEAGQSEFGESYVQEALEKMRQLEDKALHWHFIGPIQTNKTKDIATHFDWVHSLCRIKVAERLNEQRPANLPPLNICIQINTSQEASKSGILINEIQGFADALVTLPRLRLRGLMTIPASSDYETEQRKPFHALHDAFVKLKEIYPDVDTLSMGMSGDLEAAIAEGSTIVRVGTAIFGKQE